MSKYEYKTYGQAKVLLEAGYYTKAELEQIIHVMGSQQEIINKSMGLIDPAFLARPKKEAK